LRPPTLFARLFSGRTSHWNSSAPLLKIPVAKGDACMKSAKRPGAKERLYIGMDIGGTNIQASLVQESGVIVGSARVATPRDDSVESVVAAMESAVEKVINKHGLSGRDLRAMGIAVPGVVDPDSGYVAATPNLCLSGVSLGPLLEERFRIPITLGNDGNLGALGETWLGSARKAKSVLWICVGTGIGSGLVLRGKLWRGFRESAGEIGHTIMQIGGPQCGCGNSGCLEALASRSAIERDLRAAIAAGRKSAITELAGGDLSVIRSGILRKALAAGDELVAEVLQQAAETLGYACINLRHVVDPEVIVLGGGVIEACGDFIVPIVESVVEQDRLAGARPGRKILLSALGDDAVVLGAVAAARTFARRNPFKKRYRAIPAYSQIAVCGDGQLTVGGKNYKCDIHISVNGKTKNRHETAAAEAPGYPHLVGARELEIVCRGGPAVLYIGAGDNGHVELSDEGRAYLERRSIKCKILDNSKAVKSYNNSNRRRAALIHLGG
jgi:glucokinase